MNVDQSLIFPMDLPVAQKHEASVSDLTNKDGCIKLRFVRKAFNLHTLDGVKVMSRKLSQSDIKEITSLYVEWRDTLEVMPVFLTYRRSTFIDAEEIQSNPEKWAMNYEVNTGLTAVRFNAKSSLVCYEEEKSELHLIPSCKRGNDVYIKQVRRKFKPVIDLAYKNKTFFSTRINKNRTRVKRTKLLYITGTCDHAITGDIDRSWLKFGEYWNSFVTNVREQFSGAEYIRAWQSQKNGYPHFHALIYFPNFEFSVVPWYNVKKKKWEFRVHNRQQHNGKIVRERLKDAWKWGNLDILAVSSLKKGIVDIVKYITRDLEGGESDLTNAMVWFFGKQSYSLSKNFTTVLVGENIALAEPTNDDLINAEGVIQRSNSKGTLVRIEVYPIIKAEKIPKYTQLNFQDYKDPPDIAWETRDFVEKYAHKCVPSSFKTTEDGVEIIVYKRED